MAISHISSRALIIKATALVQKGMDDWLDSDAFDDAVADAIYAYNLELYEDPIQQPRIDWYKQNEACLNFGVQHPNDDLKHKTYNLPLSEAVLAAAEDEDEGYTVAGTIEALEKSIAKMKAGMAERGWSADAHA